MPSAEPNGGSLPPTFSQWMEHDDDDDDEEEVYGGNRGLIITQIQTI